MDRPRLSWLNLWCGVLALTIASASWAGDDPTVTPTALDDHGFTHVLLEAATQGKLVLIDFFTDW